MKISALSAAVTCHQALAHPTRLCALAVLRDGWMCMGELQELLGAAFSTISRHVAELERVGLVEQIKEGRWVWCRLAEGREAHRVLGCIWEQLSEDPGLAEDRRRARLLRSTRQASDCGAVPGPCSGEIALVAGDAAAAPEKGAR